MAFTFKTIPVVVVCALDPAQGSNGLKMPHAGSKFATSPEPVVLESAP
jgi:hypothetical protein